MTVDMRARQQRKLPCTNQPTTLALSASGDTNVVVICAGPPGSGGQSKQAWTTADAGRTWTRAGDPPVAGYASSVATTSGTFLTGSRNAVLVTPDGGRSWPISDLTTDGGHTWTPARFAP